MIEVFVDGSCKGNPGPGGFGAVVVDNGKKIFTYQERSEQTTNNREEMKAIIWALRLFGSAKDIIVYSDSSYCVNTFNTWIHNWKANGWKRAKGKPIENLDLVKEFDESSNRGYKIDLRKIAGHAGHKWNEMADGLATGRIKNG